MNLPSHDTTRYLLNHLQGVAEALHDEQRSIGIAIAKLSEQRRQIVANYLQSVNEELAPHSIEVVFEKTEWEDNDTPNGIPPRYFFTLVSSGEALITMEYKELYKPKDQFLALLDFLNKQSSRINSIVLSRELEQSLTTKTITKRVKI